MSVHDRWNGARTGAGQRWEVRWREGGQQRKQRFPSRTAADLFDARRLLDPAEVAATHRSRLTVSDVVAAWLATTTGLQQKTRDAYRVDAREIVQAFGDRLAASVKPSEVRVWSGRDRGASLRRRSFTAMRRAYKLAIADELLRTDPTDGLPLPKIPRGDMRFLDWQELAALAAAAGPSGPLIWTLGTCGMRLGEALGLDGGDVDRMRKRLRIRRSYSVSSKGAQLGPTKGARAREVPVSDFVLQMLPDRAGPLFVGVRGGRLDQHWWRTGVFQPAALAAGLGKMHPHELRHTAASLAIASGADVKAVQRMLGHQSAAMTLDLYGHLWDAQLDTVTARMDEARIAAGVLERPVLRAV